MCDTILHPMKQDEPNKLQNIEFWQESRTQMKHVGEYNTKEHHETFIKEKLKSLKPLQG